MVLKFLLNMHGNVFELVWPEGFIEKCKNHYQTIQ